MSNLYEVSSLTAFVMKKASSFSIILGVLTRGTQIDVINISGDWAHIKYNNKDGYVKKNNLSLVNNTSASPSGSVTIKFLDLDTNVEIHPSETIDNLQFTSYTYEAENIYGYNLISTTPLSVTLTNEEPNQTVIFHYTKILCTLTIEYIDEATGESIANSETITDLSLGSYSYAFIEIDGYSLNDSEIKIVTLTASNPNQKIAFKYTSKSDSTTTEPITTQ